MNYSEITTEALKSQVKYGHFNSTHEVYAVLKEEVDEFWDIVKEKNIDGNEASPKAAHKRDRMIKELTQIAAIAQRAIQEIENKEIRWI